MSANIVSTNEQVARLEVAVHEASFVRVAETERRLADHLTSEPGWDLAAATHEVVEIVAVDVLHHEEEQVFGAVGVERADDVGMLEGRDRPYLPLESADRVGAREHRFADDLERDDTIHHRVACAKDDAHAAAAEPLEQSVIPEIESSSAGEKLLRLPASQLPARHEGLEELARIAVGACAARIGHFLEAVIRHKPAGIERLEKIFGAGIRHRPRSCSAGSVPDRSPSASPPPPRVLEPERFVTVESGS